MNTPADSNTLGDDDDDDAPPRIDDAPTDDNDAPIDDDAPTDDNDAPTNENDAAGVDSATETRSTPLSSDPVSGKPTSGVDNPETPVRLVGGRRVSVAGGADRRRYLTIIAAAQRGRITTRQAVACGYTDRKLRTAVDHGILIREHRGVFVVAGQAPDVPLGRETGALLALGNRAALSAVSNLIAVKLLPPDPNRPIDIALIGAGHRDSRPGITVHRYHDLTVDQVRTIDGLPMCVTERALLDAADFLEERALEKAVDDALGRRLTSRTKIRELLDHCGIGRHGSVRLSVLIDPNRPNSSTESKPQELALKLIREAGLPEPETEAELYGFRADFFFRDARVVFEVDSHAWHGLVRRNFERDRTKDRVFRQHGIDVVRASPEALEQRPLPTIADLAMAIARGLARPAQRAA